MSVGVRVLCQFTAKRGDLDLRFTPAPSAREGIAGHVIVAARRGRSYEAEVILEDTHDEIRVSGRADGYDSKERRLDECKSYRGELARMPGNHRALHWAQAKMYGAMLCRKRQLREILPQLNDVSEQMRRRMEELFGAGYAYTYLYPGLRKIVQAAGRVIRTRHDRGVVYLIDDRFARREVRELLPSWWNLQVLPLRAGTS